LAAAEIQTVQMILANQLSVGLRHQFPGLVSRWLALLD
jgi:hypothetical protein